MHSPLTVSHADPRPMYLQIMEQIRHRIAAGDWLPGQEIPSIRTLAIDTQVSVITVKRAYMELEREGVIVAKQGKGSFVAEHVTLRSRLRSDELDQHLAAAAAVARLMGVGIRDVEARLRALMKKGTDKE